MSQGLLWNIDIDGTSMDFKSISVRETSSSIDRTSKFNPDGTTNLGFTATVGDCRTLFVTIDEILTTVNNIGLISGFAAGQAVNGSTVLISYAGVQLYTMSGYYVDDVESSGSIPGEARARLAIHSVGPYTKP